MTFQRFAAGPVTWAIRTGPRAGFPCLQPVWGQRPTAIGLGRPTRPGRPDMSVFFDFRSTGDWLPGELGHSQVHLRTHPPGGGENCSADSRDCQRPSSWHCRGVRRMGEQLSAARPAPGEGSVRRSGHFAPVRAHHVTSERQGWAVPPAPRGQWRKPPSRCRWARQGGGCWVVVSHASESSPPS